MRQGDGRDESARCVPCEPQATGMGMPAMTEPRVARWGGGKARAGQLTFDGHDYFDGIK